MQLPFVSAHAVKRYMERTGCKSPERARNKIEHCFITGRKLKTKKNAADKVYGHGFVLVIKDNLIITIYRPSTPQIQKLIYNAIKNEQRHHRQPPSGHETGDGASDRSLPKGRSPEED